MNKEENGKLSEIVDNKSHASLGLGYRESIRETSITH